MIYIHSREVPDRSMIEKVRQNTLDFIKIHSRMTRHHKRKRRVRQFTGLQCLALVSSVAWMPHSLESFQFTDRVPSSFLRVREHTKYNSMASRSIRKGQRLVLQSKQNSATSISAHSLTTALEGLWEDRVEDSADDEDDNSNDYESLVWLDLDPGLNSKNDEQFSSSDAKHDSTPIKLPLYPLSEVYLPMSTSLQTPDTVVNHTLNNVEPQNVRMALDLLSQTDQPPRFCVVLRAIDTGRIASIGNILRIVDADIQKISTHNGNDSDSYDVDDIDKIIRIRLACQSEGLVEILEVENGSGWGEKRLLRSDEYLQALLRPILTENDEEHETNSDWQAAYTRIRQDLRTIKLIYQLELGSEEYPPDTLKRLGNEIQDFPDLEDCNETADILLWKLAQEWQSVCMTLRQGRQALLATERNERMVEAACSYGGPLKLPIHLSDLDPKSRQEIQDLDYDFQLEHEESGMDPTLDFQVLIGLGSTDRRFDFLAKLVARERMRLEMVASKLSSSR